MQQKRNGVFYTDGGYRAKIDSGGWGFHGYIYDAEPYHGDYKQKNWTITPCGYIKPAQYTPTLQKQCVSESGIINDPEKHSGTVNVIEYVDAFGAVNHPATNNRAELTALLRVLEYIETLALTNVWVFSDSRYVVDGYNQRLEQLAHDGAVNNQSLWSAVIELKKRLNGCGLHIDWIKGHASSLEGVSEDFLGNAIADRLASAGILRAQCGIHEPMVVCTPAKRYWIPDSYRHDFFTHNRWYFNTAHLLADYTDEGHRLYYFGNHGKDDDFLGKRMSDASFSVIMCQSPEPVLESLRGIERCLDIQAHNSLMIGRMDFIFKPVVYQALQRHQGWCVRQPTKKLDLYYDQLQLTKELRPPRLAYNLIEIMEILEGLLLQVHQGISLPGTTITEVTEQFYQTTKKKPTLLESLPQSAKSHRITITHPLNDTPTELVISLGIDCPNRQTLSKLAAQRPRLFIVTWRESLHAFRYAFCVQTPENTGIYSGFYSNLHFI